MDYLKELNKALYEAIKSNNISEEDKKHQIKNLIFRFNLKYKKVITITPQGNINETVFLKEGDCFTIKNENSIVIHYKLNKIYLFTSNVKNYVDNNISDMKYSDIIYYFKQKIDCPQEKQENKS